MNSAINYSFRLRLITGTSATDEKVHTAVCAIHVYLCTMSHLNAHSALISSFPTALLC